MAMPPAARYPLSISSMQMFYLAAGCLAEILCKAGPGSFSVYVSWRACRWLPTSSSTLLLTRRSLRYSTLASLIRGTEPKAPRPACIFAYLQSGSTAHFRARGRIAASVVVRRRLC